MEYYKPNYTLLIPENGGSETSYRWQLPNLIQGYKRVSLVMARIQNWYEHAAISNVGIRIEEFSSPIETPGGRLTFWIPTLLADGSFIDNYDPETEKPGLMLFRSLYEHEQCVQISQPTLAGLKIEVLDENGNHLPLMKVALLLKFE